MNDAIGMKGQRSRNTTEPFRKKRGDTYVSTIEKKYEVDFGVRGNMHLSTLLERENKDSLNDLINNQ